MKQICRFLQNKLSLYRSIQIKSEYDMDKNRKSMDHHSERQILITRDHSSIVAKTPCNFPLADNAVLEGKLRCRLDELFGLMPRYGSGALMIQYTLTRGIKSFPIEKRH